MATPTQNNFGTEVIPPSGGSEKIEIKAFNYYLTNINFCVLIKSPEIIFIKYTPDAY